MGCLGPGWRHRDRAPWGRRRTVLGALQDDSWALGRAGTSLPPGRQRPCAQIWTMKAGTPWSEPAGPRGYHHPDSAPGPLSPVLKWQRQETGRTAPEKLREQTPQQPTHGFRPPGPGRRMSHQQGPPTLPACTVPQGGCLASFPVGERVRELLTVMEEVDPRPPPQHPVLRKNTPGARPADSSLLWGGKWPSS